MMLRNGRMHGEHAQQAAMNPGHIVTGDDRCRAAGLWQSRICTNVAYRMSLGVHARDGTLWEHAASQSHTTLPETILADVIPSGADSSSASEA